MPSILHWARFYILKWKYNLNYVSRNTLINYCCVKRPLFAKIDRKHVLHHFFVFQILCIYVQLGTDKMEIKLMTDFYVLHAEIENQLSEQTLC